MRIIAVGVCIGICIVVQPCTTATLFNGDFERVHDNKPVGWEGDCVARGGKVWRWRYFKARFNTREYRRIRIYLRMHFAVGKVWFDDVSVSGLKIANASFEQADGNDITAWQQDDVGRTIFIDRAIAHSGKCSVRIECKQKRMSRIWQTVDCKPNTWHDFSFWAQCEGIKFNIAYGEIYGIKPDGSHGKILTQVGNMAGTTDEEHGNYVCEIRRDALGDALAWRFAQLPPNANLLLRCDVKTERLSEGVAIFRIADANGHALGRVTAERKVGWQSLAVNVKTPTTGRIKIALGIENGRGTVWFDNIKVMKHSIVPPPQKITWLPASDNFKLTRDAVIVVRDGASGRDLTGVQMLQREVHHIARIKLPIVEASKWHGGRAIIVGEANAPHVARTIAEEKITVPNRDEGYALIVTPKRIVVAGHDPAGTFYGIMTLLQMLVRYGDDAEIVAVRIEDYPDLPFRCTYGLYAGNAQIAAETFARLKLNAVLYESGAYYSLDDERIRNEMQRMFETMRLHFIEPIPELQSFGHGGIILSRNPNCAEGIWVQNEAHVLKGMTPVALNHTNVLITPSTHITVTSADGKVTYVEGRDYRVIAGKTAYPYDPRNEPFKIARISTGRIKDGEKVLVSYDYAPPRTSAYCPNEPLVYEIMRRAIHNTMRHLKPRYLHVGHDEIWRMGTDSRCKHSGRSNAENLAMELRRLLAFAREVDPRVKIMLWADMLNPFHNGIRVHKVDPTAPATDMLPRDAFIMNVWFYGAGQPPDVGWRSLLWFAKRGFAMTGSPWFNTRNAYEWANVCYVARQRGMPCMGVIYTSWRRRWDALATCASYAWHHDEGFRMPEH